MAKPTRFNIRVYGLLIEQGRILIAEENINGEWVIKLPGGGMEPGEGTRECLEREFREEAGLNINVAGHFYTTDFFQQSAFDANDQLISIYYFVTTGESHKITTGSNHGSGELKDTIFFHWLALDALDAERFFFPVDKYAIRMLMDNRMDGFNF